MTKKRRNKINFTSNLNNLKLQLYDFKDILSNLFIERHNLSLIDHKFILYLTSLLTPNKFKSNIIKIDFKEFKNIISNLTKNEIDDPSIILDSLKESYIELQSVDNENPKSISFIKDYKKSIFGKFSIELDEDIYRELTELKNFPIIDNLDYALQLTDKTSLLIYELTLENLIEKDLPLQDLRDIFALTKAGKNLYHPNKDNPPL